MIAPVETVMGLFVMLGLGGGGLPLGVPPMPEDPVLAKVAPAECLFYASWAGTAKPDPKSTNQTEQLLAEPEVRQMVAELERRIRSSLSEAAKREGPAEAAVLVDDAIGWAKTLLTRPTAVFLTSVKPPAGPSQGPEIRGGLVVNVGEDGAKLKAALEKWQPALLRGPAKAEELEIAGQKWHLLRLDPGAPPITWGIKGNHLMVGIGEGEVEAMLKRAGGSAPPWLTAVRKQLPVERPSSVTHVNLKAVIELVAIKPESVRPRADARSRADAPPDNRRGRALEGTVVEHRVVEHRAFGVSRQITDAVGLGNVTSLSAVSGLDKEGFVSRTLLAIDGEPQGILALATEKPLTAADLAPIPRDAVLAVAARVNPERFFETIVSLVGKIEPREREFMLRDMARTEQELGIDIRNDILKAVGDTWCVYASPGEGGLIPIGFVAVGQVKDHKRLAAAHQKLMAALKAELDREAELREKYRAKDTKRPKVVGPGGIEEEPRYRPPVYRRFTPSPRLEQFQFAGQEVYFFNARESDFPLAPAWCLTEKEVIFSLFPQGVKAYLSRGAKAASLAKAPEVAAVFKDGGPLGLVYCDTRTVFEIVYPFVPMFAQAFLSELQREGIDLNISMLPSAKAIGPHLTPSVTIVRRTKAGIEVSSRQSIPGGDMVLTAPAAGLVMWLEYSTYSTGKKNIKVDKGKATSAAKATEKAVETTQPAEKSLPPAKAPDFEKRE